MNPPLISVIIPSYNSEKTIEEAIVSIENQTYKNIEIIVVDDNSTDNTKDVVEKLILKYPNISYHQLKNDDKNRFNKKGRNINAGYSSRNYGFEKVKGEWITFQDSDDVSLKNRIEVEYNLAKKYGATHVVIDWIKYDEKYVDKSLDIDNFVSVSNYSIIEKEEITKLARKTKGILMTILGRYHKYIPFEIKQKPIINKLFLQSLAPYPCAGNSPLFKKEVINKVKFRPLDERVWPSYVGRGADRDFNFQVAETFKKSFAFSIPLYMWRQKDDNPKYKDYDKYIN